MHLLITSSFVHDYVVEHIGGNVINVRKLLLRDLETERNNYDERERHKRNDCLWSFWLTDHIYCGYATKFRMNSSIPAADHIHQSLLHHKLH